MLSYFRISILFILFASLNIQSMQYVKNFFNKLQQKKLDQLKRQQEAEEWINGNPEVVDYTRHVVSQIMDNGPILKEPTLQNLAFVISSEREFKNQCYYTIFPTDRMIISAGFAEGQQNLMICKSIFCSFKS